LYGEERTEVKLKEMIRNNKTYTFHLGIISNAEGINEIE
jgi:hypothetical protein